MPPFTTGGCGTHEAGWQSRRNVLRSRGGTRHGHFVPQSGLQLVMREDDPVGLQSKEGKRVHKFYKCIRYLVEIDAVKTDDKFKERNVYNEPSVLL